MVSAWVRVWVNSSSQALEPCFLARSTAAQAVRTAAVAVPQAARKTPSIVTLPTVNASRLTPSSLLHFSPYPSIRQHRPDNP
jgi:hypothetical protein